MLHHNEQHLLFVAGIYAMLKPILGAVALYALAVVPAYAVLIVQTGNNPQTDNNVINGGACAGASGPALAIEGCFNSQNTPIVNILSDENIVYGSGGQATIQGFDGNDYSRLTISVDAANINTLILNIDATVDGFVRFTDGTTTSALFALDDNGQNFFTITGGPFPFISYTTFASNGTTESDIVDETKQIRIGLSTPTQVPEPATLALFGLGLLGLGLVARRRTN
jgi:hypothetical protein